GDGISKGWHDLGLQVPPSLTRQLASSFDAHFGMADYRHRRLTWYRRSILATVAETADGQLLTNAPGRGPHHLSRSLLHDLNHLDNNDVMSAYSPPPRQPGRASGRAARQGRKTRLILAGKSDVPLSQSAARHLYTGMLRAGIELYEYQPQILHTK